MTTKTPSTTQSQLTVRLVGVANATTTTGLSRYARNLQQALSALGVSIELTATQLPPIPKPAVRLARRAGYDLNTFFTTYPLLVPAGSHGYITHLTSQNQASALALRSSHLQPAIVTVHDLITLAFRHKPELTGYMKVYDRVFDNLTARGLKKAAWLLADSEQTRRDIITFLGYPPERVKVVYLGINHQLFQPQVVTADFYLRYNLQQNVPYLLYTGSEDPRKNLRRLIAAFAQVLKRVPEVRLLKVGAARFEQERHQFLTYLGALGLSDKVLFFDQVSDADLAAFYNLAKVFVFPSLYEGFGLPPLEAMACGTPVVSSNSSSLPEVLGEAALTFNPYEVDEMAAAIERAVTDTTLQADLRQRGLANAARFSWERTARETIAVYNCVTQMNTDRHR